MPRFALGGPLHHAAAARGFLRDRRHVLRLGDRTCRIVVRIRQARLVANCPRVRRPRRTINAYVRLTIIIPVARHRPIGLGAELRPQVAFVPTAVAVEIEEPVAVDVHADVADAVAVEVAGHRHRVRVAKRLLAQHRDVAPLETRERPLALDPTAHRATGSRRSSTCIGTAWPA